MWEDERKPSVGSVVYLHLDSDDIEVVKRALATADDHRAERLAFEIDLQARAQLRGSRLPLPLVNS
jgi:hypothetical protein